MTSKTKPCVSAIDQFKLSRDSIAQLCEHVVNGGHLAGFCKERSFPYTTISDWINADPVRAVMYARARVDRSDVLADELVAISDEIDVKTRVGEDGEVHLLLDAAAVARNRLRVDARKWYASKLNPRVYGDKIDSGENKALDVLTSMMSKLADKLPV
jgi:hypothetical protein